MRNRRFGVEIECGMPQGTSQAISVLNAAGFDAGHGFNNEHTYTVHSDGSGVEIGTPPLSGKEGFRELERVFGVLREAGAYVSQADGMHVHHDAPDYVDNEQAVLRLVKSWEANQGVVEQFVVPYRRGGYGACPSWLPSEVAQLERRITADEPFPAYAGPDYFSSQGWQERPGSPEFKAKINGHGRKSLNISALIEHGTVEFRLHEGSLDFEKAEAWIRFGQRFLDSVQKATTPLAMCTLPEELLTTVKANKTVTRVLLQKVAEPTVLLRYSEARERARVAAGLAVEEPGYCDYCDQSYYYCEECDEDHCGCE